ncbi:hypothetical protein A3J15_03565 [Candidatus Roizmanbacteria bacterium RIFCSPLOWO2_02_FULL_38_10]|uniref:CBS domain-containing protein n=1 Tax=Candidatus Roizmanbacteria bacterium RIFCSPLOWO2_02_FULL_38_10 TaxID=1802074 RepID=A0A1F7JKW3_9BACT|nr:MAG: hypothetical protein A3J15_03565 [Candidatus Roizmanbacteria bacterium RIFCSPLOWO2_02_FULL_38_10]
MILKKLYRTENIIKTTPDESLSSIMPYFNSSHDAAFVFDPEGIDLPTAELLGAINPYYCLIKKSYPANTKARHCLIHPPKVDINSSLQKVARLMTESKIHYLPVFENGKFIGIISARRILDGIQDTEELKVPVGRFINRKRPLISVFENDYISKALTLFKKHGISKLIVLSTDLHIRGILSYFDLISFLTMPKKRQGSMSREGNKIPLLHSQVKNFMKLNVLSLTQQDTLADAAKLILKNKIGSVLIVDNQGSPIGIITTRDILSTFSGKFNFLKIDVVAKDLSAKSADMVNQFLSIINRRFIKKHDVERAKVIVKEKHGSGVFEVILSFVRRGSSPKVIKEEGKNLFKILKDLIRRSKNVTSSK